MELTNSVYATAICKDITFWRINLKILLFGLTLILSLSSLGHEIEYEKDSYLYYLEEIVNATVTVNIEHESEDSKEISIITNILSESSSKKSWCKKGSKLSGCYRIYLVTEKVNMKPLAKKFCGEDYDVAEISHHKLHEKVGITPFFDRNLKVEITDARETSLYALKGAKCIKRESSPNESDSE